MQKSGLALLTKIWKPQESYSKQALSKIKFLHFQNDIELQ